MIVEKYVVVNGWQLEKRFTKFHETREQAIEEAERLCKKEKVPFYVLEVIGEVQIADVPVKWEWFKKDGDHEKH